MNELAIHHEPGQDKAAAEDELQNELIPKSKIASNYIRIDMVIRGKLKIAQMKP